MGIFHKTHLRIPNWNVAKFTCEVKKSSSKLLVEKSMHGPSNLDHPPAMEETGEDLLLHRGWDPEDVTKRGNFERIFFFLGELGRIFRNGNFGTSSKSPEGGTILVSRRDYLKFRPFWFSFHFPSASNFTIQITKQIKRIRNTHYF